jgi:hypothetical protein
MMDQLLLCLADLLAPDAILQAQLGTAPQQATLAAPADPALDFARYSAALVAKRVLKARDADEVEVWMDDLLADEEYRAASKRLFLHALDDPTPPKPSDVREGVKRLLGDGASTRAERLAGRVALLLELSCEVSGAALVQEVGRAAMVEAHDQLLSLIFDPDTPESELRVVLAVHTLNMRAMTLAHAHRARVTLEPWLSEALWAGLERDVDTLLGLLAALGVQDPRLEALGLPRVDVARWDEERAQRRLGWEHIERRAREADGVLSLGGA